MKTWDILENDFGDLMQQETGQPIPEGWRLLVVTSRENYLQEHLSQLGAAGS